mgnify:CR=1 FL=1
MTEEQAKKMIELLESIQGLHREAYDRQTRLVWVAIPCFAVLCVQTVLLIMR